MALATSLRALTASTILALSATAFHQFFSPDHAIAADVDPVHIYAQLPRTSSVRVSPDGKYVAMLEPISGTKAVFVYNLQNPNANRIMIPTPEDSIVKAIDWASDKHVVMLARIRDNVKQGKMKRYSNLFSRWVSTNVETQKSTILMEKKIKDLGYKSRSGGAMVHDLTSDPKNIMMGMSEYVGKPLTRHFKVDLDTGKARLNKSLPYTTGRVVRSLDGSKILAREDYDRRSGRYGVYLGEYPNDELVYSTKFTNKDRPTMGLITMLDGKPLLQETEKERLTLHTVEPATKSLRPFSINANVPSGYSYGPIFDNFTRELIGVNYTDDLSRQVYSAQPFKSWHSKAKKALRGKNVRILSYTRDHSVVTLFAESSTNPGEFYLFEPAKGQIEPLGGAYPELKSSQVGKTIRADYSA